VGEASADSTYLIAVFASEIQPGRHTLHLRVQNLVTGELRTAEVPLQVRPFGGGFRMSDLQVCEVFRPAANPASLPRPWRRIDRASVPQPDATIPEARNEVYLYFEAYDATVNDQGQADLRVTYRIYRAADHRRIRDTLVDSTAPLPVDETRFPVESVRALSDGSVFKGTRVSLEGLESGTYAVVVEIEDVASGNTAESVAHLRRWWPASRYVSSGRGLGILARMSYRGFLLLAVALLGGCAPRLVVRPLAWWHDEVVWFVDTEDRSVALTIDDAPDPDSTPQILDVLRRHDARATFFVIGEQARHHRELLARMLAEGHELANHGMEDRPSVSLTRRGFERDLRETATILESAGAKARWFRPGSGWFDGPILGTLERNGYICAMGDIYPLDGTLPVRGLASWWIRHGVRPGSIVILHDRGERGLRTATILAEVLPQLAARGYRVVTLSELTRAGR